jgi:DTW domain-containing protein YfiP
MFFPTGANPFICRDCWCFLPVCVCDHPTVVIDKEKNPKESSTRLLNPRIKVVVWFHHKEWGLTSNTWGLLMLALGNESCKLFMKGFPEHDDQFQSEYLNKHSKEKLVVVLCPNNQGKSKSDGLSSSDAKPTAALEDLRKELVALNRREVILVAVDGTWRNARRMVGRLPSYFPRLDIPSNVVHTLFSEQKLSASLLSPLRSKGPSQRARADDTLVCTAEAVTMALKELGLSSKDAENILNLVRAKVDLVRKYQGHD